MMRSRQWLTALVPASLAVALASHAVRPGGPHDPRGAGATANGGLVGWWMLNEASGSYVADSSGTNNHGQLQGGASYVPGGVNGAAVKLAAFTGVITIPHHPSLEPAIGTIELWINVPALKDADVVTKTATPPGGVGGSVIGLRIEADGGVLALIKNDDPATPNGPWRSAEVNSGAIRPGVWHHLAMRWDGAALTLFVDGAARARTPYRALPGSGLAYQNGSPLYFGLATAWATPGDHEYLGLIDDIRYFAMARPDRDVAFDYRSRGRNSARPPGRGL